MIRLNECLLHNKTVEESSYQEEPESPDYPLQTNMDDIPYENETDHYTSESIHL